MTTRSAVDPGRQPQHHARARPRDGWSHWFLVAGPRVLRDGSGPPPCWSDPYLRADLRRRDTLPDDALDIAVLRDYHIEQGVRADLISDQIAEPLQTEPGSPALVIAARYTAPTRACSRPASTPTRPTGTASRRRCRRRCVGPDPGAMVSYRHRVASTRRLFTALTQPGPHRVLRGDLAFAGLPGVVHAPEAGFNLPAVAFGHDWLTGVDRYSRLLEHLASWGIVVVAPDTERGLAPSVLNLAFDLGAALDIATGMRLGSGRISVHRNKIGVVGHGFGGSAAVFAAAGMSVKPQAVAAIFPTVTAPPAEDPAATLTVPGVVFSAPGDPTALRSNTVQLSRAWRSATVRVIAKASPAGLPEGRRLTGFVGLPTSDRRTQRRVRALLAGYLLAVLARDKTYRQFADPQAHLPKTQALDHPLEPAAPEEKIAALLK